MAHTKYLIQWIGENDFGFYRTLGPTFDRTLLEKGDFYFCHDKETSDHFDSQADAAQVLAFLKSARPEYTLNVLSLDVHG